VQFAFFIATPTRAYGASPEGPGASVARVRVNARAAVGWGGWECMRRAGACGRRARQRASSSGADGRVARGWGGSEGQRVNGGM